MRILMVIAGVLLAAAGAVAAATFGPSGTLQTSSIPLSTQPKGHALVADVLGVSAGFPGSGLIGTPTLGADSVGPERLFVGIGARDDVDSYLSGVAFEAVRQDGDTWQQVSIPGARRPGVPTEEDFWIERGTGNAPVVDFATTNAGTTFVVMRDDGSAEVDARILIGYTSPVIFPLGVGAVVVGILLILGGILLMRRRRGDGDTAAGKATDATAPTPAAGPEQT